MSDSYELRYEGKRWVLRYGAYAGIERFALEELQRVVQASLPYVVRVEPAETSADGKGTNLLMLGTPENNPLIAELIAMNIIAPPVETEGYTVASLASPWDGTCRLLVVAGRDARGVLYGVEHFCALSDRYITVTKGMGATDRRRALDAIGPFTLTEHPRIAHRGLWSWGYVVYDYRAFITNMARLRMNTLTLWNDVPPLNIEALLDYAHARGVYVNMAFPCGWGRDYDLTLAEHRERIVRDGLAHWHEHYRDLDVDGIYFQTLTEHTNTMLGKQSVASITCEMVNDIARRLLKAAPGLRIQWGLHAGSIGEQYPELAALDERVEIIWEDAGVIPYSYFPTTTYDERVLPHCRAAGLGTVDATLDFSKRLATFRPNRQFGMVAKGWTCLDWEHEFEHHGPYIMGERDRAFCRRRLAARQKHWAEVNAAWMEHYPLALRFYREILGEAPAQLSVQGVVEDGLFEAAIQPSVALLAACLWNPMLDERDILRLAMSPYYRQTELVTE